MTQRRSGGGEISSGFDERYLRDRYVQPQGRWRRIWQTLLPTVQVDRVYPDDDLRQWAVHAQGLGATVADFPTVTFIAGRDAAYVSRIDVWHSFTGVTVIDVNFLSIQTLLDGYNPFDGLPAPGNFLPWLWTADSTPYVQAKAVVSGGAALTQQTVLVDAIPIITVGPTYPMPNLQYVGGLLPTVIDLPRAVHLPLPTPWLYVAPFRGFYIQALPGFFVPGVAMNVAIWWSERPTRRSPTNVG